MPAPEAAIAAPPAATPAPPELAPSPPARPTAPVAWPARQVVPFAVALALGPDASISLTLDPGELGRVEVAIERSGGEALVTLRADRPETLALLQRDRAELERALADAGLAGQGRGPALSFGLGGEGAASQGRRGGKGAAAGGGAPRPAAAGAAPSNLVAPRGLIDIAI